jgi:hypothetical protein
MGVTSIATCGNERLTDGVPAPDQAFELLQAEHVRPAAKCADACEQRTSGSV